MTTANRTARRATWTALPLGLALVGALTLSPALAQGAAADATTDASATIDAEPGARAFSLRRGPDGGFAMHGLRVGPRAEAPRGALGRRLEVAAMRGRERSGGEARRSDAFARWLEIDADAGPVVPGLVGRVATGTTVRLAFFAGAPEEGGTELATLTFVAGTDDAAAFRDAVRTAAEGASHVAVDVLGRIVALPESAPSETAE